MNEPNEFPEFAIQTQLTAVAAGLLIFTLAAGMVCAELFVEVFAKSVDWIVIVHQLSPSVSSQNHSS